MSEIKIVAKLPMNKEVVKLEIHVAYGFELQNLVTCKNVF